MCAVDPADPAFQNPNKPIGPFYTKEVAEEKSKTLGWNVVEDASRGYRRVVPSPQPKEILQLEVIKKNIEMDILTVALGGGGIPVVKKENGEIEGSEAVIDKDRSSALLAFDLDVDVFIISTDADAAYLDFKKPTMRSISHATVAEMEQYVKEGHFAPGSMLPKIESAIKFVKNGGKKAIITSYEYLMDALEGKAGTHITA